MLFSTEEEGIQPFPSSFSLFFFSSLRVCSDGAGRTGTYILIDMVLNKMAKGGWSHTLVPIQVPHLVSRRRQQRVAASPWQPELV